MTYKMKDAWVTGRRCFDDIGFQSRFDAAVASHYGTRVYIHGDVDYGGSRGWVHVKRLITSSNGDYIHTDGETYRVLNWLH